MKVIICVIAALLVLLPCGSSQKIAAFNVQIFGTSKAAKPEVMATLVKIIRRYDVILIQEIRDSSGKAVKKLLSAVNAKGGDQYTMKISERLGRTTSKEQYAFFYKVSSSSLTLSVKEIYTYSDRNDIFEREPYAVHFTSTSDVLQEFALVGIHTKPDTAVEEMNALDDVRDLLKGKWNTENILLLGDFNADCSYASKTKLRQLDLRKSDKWKWWIGDDVDTTVSNSNCAYDRFVMTGDQFINSVNPSSVEVFRFDRAYGLTQEQALKVSDHYPIEMTIKPGTNAPQNFSGAPSLMFQTTVLVLLLCFMFKIKYLLW